MYGYGTPHSIPRTYTWREWDLYLDAVGRRLHNDYRREFGLHGGDPGAIPDYEGPEEGRISDDERQAAIEREAETSPFYRHVSLEAMGLGPDDTEH